MLNQSKNRYYLNQYIFEKLFKKYVFYGERYKLSMYHSRYDGGYHVKVMQNNKKVCEIFIKDVYSLDDLYSSFSYSGDNKELFNDIKENIVSNKNKLYVKM